MKNTPLHPEDPDLILAQKMGALLEGTSVSTTSEESPLVDVLLMYGDEKRRQSHTFSQDEALRDKLWARVNPAIRKASGRPAVRHARNTPRIIRPIIFATCAFVLAIGIFLFSQSNTTELLARTEAERLIYTLEDGTTITLRPYTTLYADKKEAHHYKLEGEAFFDVTPNPDRPFRVQTQTATVAVLGTRFMLQGHEGKESVFLEEGNISYSIDNGRSAIIVQPGQLASFTDEGLIIEEGAVPRQQAMDWINDQLFFSQMPFEEVAEEFGHHFGISIEIPESLKGETLSGTLALTSLENALNSLALTAMGPEASIQQIDARSYRFVLP